MLQYCCSFSARFEEKCLTYLQGFANITKTSDNALCISVKIIYEKLKNNDNCVKNTIYLEAACLKNINVLKEINEKKMYSTPSKHPRYNQAKLTNHLSSTIQKNVET
jgi:hypothetical protein